MRIVAFLLIATFGFCSQPQARYEWKEVAAKDFKLSAGSSASWEIVSPGKLRLLVKSAKKVDVSVSQKFNSAPYLRNLSCVVEDSVEANPECEFPPASNLVISIDDTRSNEHDSNAVIVHVLEAVCVSNCATDAPPRFSWQQELEREVSLLPSQFAQLPSLHGGKERIEIRSEFPVNVGIANEFATKMLCGKTGTSITFECDIPYGTKTLFAVTDADSTRQMSKNKVLVRVSFQVCIENCPALTRSEKAR